MGINIKTLVLLSIACKAISGSECPKKIKFSVERIAENYSYYFEEETVSPPYNAFSITIEENVPILCKGMLNIIYTTDHFYGEAKGIREIEAGTFENQNLDSNLNLDSQIILSDNLLTVIRKGTFKNINVTELDLIDNQIVTIEEGAMENMPKLSMLYLMRNRIHEFHPNSLTKTPGMLFFDMSFNKMKQLEENHFLFMSKDRNVGIGIASNELSEIHPRAFDGIDIFTFNISNNKLKTIPKEVFSGNKLHYLSMENNQLTHLDDAFFKMNTTILRDVELKGNNFDEETTRKLKPFMEIIEGNKRHDTNIHF